MCLKFEKAFKRNIFFNSKDFNIIFILTPLRVECKVNLEKLS